MSKVQNSKDIRDPWTGESGIYADEAHVYERAIHSRLLGPNGKPLLYKQPPPVGFDLSNRNKD